MPCAGVRLILQPGPRTDSSHNEFTFRNKLRDRRRVSTCVRLPARIHMPTGSMIVIMAMFIIGLGAEASRRQPNVDGPANEVNNGLPAIRSPSIRQGILNRKDHAIMNTIDPWSLGQLVKFMNANDQVVEDALEWISRQTWSRDQLAMILHAACTLFNMERFLVAVDALENNRFHIPESFAYIWSKRIVPPNLDQVSELKGPVAPDGRSNRCDKCWHPGVVDDHRELRALGCGNLHHKACGDHYLLRYGICPSCGEVIVPEIANALHLQSTSQGVPGSPTTFCLPLAYTDSLKRRYMRRDH